MVRSSLGTRTQRARTAGLTRTEAAQEIIEFVEVAIQCILKTRQVYPLESFVMRRKYDLVVWQTRHPGLAQYFGEALTTIRSQLLDDGSGVSGPPAGEIGLRIHSRSSDNEYERYIFKTLPVDSDFTITRATLHLHFRALIAHILELGHIPPPGVEQDRTVSIVLTLPADEQLGADADWHRVSPSTDNANLGPWCVETGVVNVQLSVAGVSLQDLGMGPKEPNPPANSADDASFSRPFVTAGVRSGADFGDDDDGG